MKATRLKTKPFINDRLWEVSFIGSITLWLAKSDRNRALYFNAFNPK